MKAIKLFFLLSVLLLLSCKKEDIQPEVMSCNCGIVTEKSEFFDTDYHYQWLAIKGENNFHMLFDYKTTKSYANGINYNQINVGDTECVYFEDGTPFNAFCD
jgi:hypothetical protein